MPRQLLASAGTLTGIEASISRFYCGTKMTLQPDGADEWSLVRTSDAKVLTNVKVIRKRGRYRFESVED